MGQKTRSTVIASAPEKQWASESGHFYWPDGRTAYEVPYKDKKRNGELRPTRITDCRELGLYPSVTTIMKLMSKGDALAGWIKKQVAMAAWTVPPGEGESQQEWVEHVLQVAEGNMASQRDKGTRDHGIVEKFFHDLSTAQEVGVIRSCEVFDKYRECMPVSAVLCALDELRLSGQKVASEKSFAHPMGYGGKIDVSGLDENWIVDFKFVDRLEKKLDYFEKCVQGAAYLVGRYGRLDHCRFANIFIETQEYSFLVREWTQEELQKGWRVFSLLHALWCEINDYHPKPLT